MSVSMSMGGQDPKAVDKISADTVRQVGSKTNLDGFELPPFAPGLPHYQAPLQDAEADHTYSVMIGMYMPMSEGCFINKKVFKGRRPPLVTIEVG